MPAVESRVESWTIGELARRTGLRPSAIRYYESAGILPAPARVGGYRRYDASVLPSLELVRLAKDAGFTIAEIRRLAQGFERGTPASARWRKLAVEKRAAVMRRIQRAERMRRLLDNLLACECVELAECPARCAPGLAPAGVSSPVEVAAAVSPAYASPPRRRS